MRLYDQILAAFKELCFGAQAPSNSVPVVFCDDSTVSGGTLNAPALNQELLTNKVSGWFDAKSFHSVALQIQTGAGISAGVISFEQTNDTTLSPNGNACLVSDAVSISTNPVGTLTLAPNTTRLFVGAITARYFRVRVSTTVIGGSVSASAVFSQEPYSATSFNMQQQAAGYFNATAVLAAGTALAADVGLQARSTTGGVGGPYRMLASAATTNARFARASAGRILKIIGRNDAASKRFLKLYNKASAPIVGTDAAITTLVLNASSDFDIDLNPYGQFFSIGIAFAITGAIDDADTTAIAANDILGLHIWIT